MFGAYAFGAGYFGQAPNQDAVVIVVGPGDVITTAMGVFRRSATGGAGRFLRSRTTVSGTFLRTTTTDTSER